MNRPRGLTLLLAILLVLTGIRYGRVVLPQKGESPAVCRSERGMVWVDLEAGFPRPGVHQFFDGRTPRSVIQMALADLPLPASLDTRLDRPLNSGERLDLVFQHGEIIDVFRNWMPAAQRMVLNIPLRTETMSGADWMALPGVGPKLAEKIETDRQKNGEFGSFEELKRVSGIGPKRIEAWRKFF